MITISYPPKHTSWTVQMFSVVSGKWVDTMATGLDEDQWAQAIKHWRMIHPQREFRPVKRVVTETIESE
jgi:hypothetical protein